MSVKHAFQPEIVTINTSSITPIKTVTAAHRLTNTYRRIAASIEHVGIIEPLIVFPTAKGTYLLLDGHTRLDILITTGVPAANCLLATDNEAYTYNKRVNYVPPIAQHHMILRALAHVSEERIAKALNVPSRPSEKSATSSRAYAPRPRTYCATSASAPGHSARYGK
jgi:hypothetical protein